MVFNWSNFEAFAPTLLGEGAAAVSFVESDYGGASAFEVDNDGCRGRVEYFQFSGGLRVIVFDCHWRSGVCYRVCDGDLVRFNFSLAIDIDMRFAANQSVTVRRPSWRIINNPHDLDVTESIPENTDAVWVTVCCHPDYLQRLTGVSLDDMPDFLQDAVDQLSDRSHHEFYDFTSRLTSITADILRTNLRGPLRLPFVEAGANQLLCYAINHLMHPRAAQALNLNDTDRAALEKGRGILASDFAAPPSVSKLSRLLGINRNKLYYGFKDLFGLTISEFIQEQRLEEGRRLLRATSLPISDVAASVGFKHQSNFATAVRKRFGVTPRQLRR